MGRPPARTLYPWDKIQRYYDEGHSARECQAKFGFALSTWSKAVDAGRVTPRSHWRPLKAYLVRGSRAGRANVKRRLLEEGLLPNKCVLCGQGPRHRGRPLVLVLDHVNGVNDDYRLCNLRLLCPNCNSQTETFTGGNRKK
jgi:hypothetical protein